MRKSTAISICFVSSISFIIALNEIHNITKERKYGFTRKLITNFLIRQHVADLTLSHYYIAGITKGFIFLGNFGKSGELLYSDLNARDLYSFQLRTADIHKIAWAAARFYVDSTAIFLIEGITPNIIKISFPGWKIQSIKIDSPYFDKALIISPSSFLGRTYNIALKSNVLFKRDINRGQIKFRKDILVNQQDGVFSTDGMLIFDQLNTSPIYLYYYRNEYICLDTNLNISSKGKTVDTISNSQITLSEIKTDKQIVFASPPLKVNKECCAWKGQLFVHSGLMADNENSQTFKNNSVIDVYSMFSHRYKFSFYLPDFAGGKLRDFTVFKNILIALQGRYLTTYQLANNLEDIP